MGQRPGRSLLLLRAEDELHASQLPMLRSARRRAGPKDLEPETQMRAGDRVCRNGYRGRGHPRPGREGRNGAEHLSAFGPDHKPCSARKLSCRDLKFGDRPWCERMRRRQFGRGEIICARFEHTREQDGQGGQGHSCVHGSVIA